ncbi:MAG: hypothetical protein SF162_00545 [bacterium]|nr:hypothetical protein [bacterium]
MNLNDMHNILFNAHILASVFLGIWSASMAFRNQSISGNFWGAVFTSALMAAVVLVVGVVMILQGLRPERLGTYIVYMSWLIVIMPGLFTLLRGRDDRSAAVAFSILCFFNAATSFSMFQRNVIGPWAMPA